MKAQIGQKIIITSYFKRVKIRGNYHTRTRKVWQEVKLNKEIEVYIIGLRNISNGWIDYMGDEGTIYSADEFFNSVLVVKSLNSKPFPISINYLNE